MKSPARCSSAQWRISGARCSRCNRFPQTLIIRLDRVPFMDITGIQTLQEVIGKLRKRGVLVLLCEANSRVYTKLQTAGVLGAGADVQASTANHSAGRSCAREWETTLGRSFRTSDYR